MANTRTRDNSDADGVLVESVCAHAVFGREQTKVFAGNKPVKRTVLATD